MAANCYHCTSNLQEVFPGHGTDPLGVCRRCHVMCCGGHAMRDPRVPEWVCCLCDLNLLATSAAVAGRDQPAPVLSRQLGRAMPFRWFLFTSLATYLAARPGLLELHPSFESDTASIAASINEDMGSMQRDREVSALWNELTPNGKLLLAAALHLAYLLRASDRDLPQPLQRLHSLFNLQGLGNG